MSMEFRLPNFQVDTPSERRMYAYLYQTVQQLNWAMKHIQTAENGSDGGVAVTAVSPARAAVQTTLAPEALSQVKSLIIKSADIVQAFSETIEENLRGEYVSQSEFGTYREETALQLQANATGITQNYTNLQQINGNLGGIQENVDGALVQLDALRQELAGVNTQLTQTSAYIRTGVIDQDENGIPIYGLEIGQTNEVSGQEVFNKYARFSSSRLSFYDQNDTEVAYISDYKLYITNVHITGTLTMGEYEINTADGLAFRWMGGNA